MYNTDRKLTEEAIMRHIQSYKYELIKLREDSELSDDESYKEEIKNLIEKLIKDADEVEEKLREVLNVK